MPGKTGAGETIGGRIAQARFSLAAKRGKNVTQAWLAAQCGVSGPTVSQWESGVTEPTIDSVRRIAKALGVSAGWLAFGETAETELINPMTDRKLSDAEVDRARAQVARDRASRTGAARKKGNDRH